MAKYFINGRTDVLHIEGLCKESSVRPYEIEYFEDEEGIRGQYHRLCKSCAKLLKTYVVRNQITNPADTLWRWSVKGTT